MSVFCRLLWSFDLKKFRCSWYKAKNMNNDSHIIATCMWRTAKYAVIRSSTNQSDAEIRKTHLYLVNRQSHHFALSFCQHSGDIDHTFDNNNPSRQVDIFMFYAYLVLVEDFASSSQDADRSGATPGLIAWVSLVRIAVLRENTSCRMSIFRYSLSRAVANRPVESFPFLLQDLVYSPLMHPFALLVHR